MWDWKRESSLRLSGGLEVGEVGGGEDGGGKEMEVGGGLEREVRLNRLGDCLKEREIF